MLPFRSPMFTSPQTEWTPAQLFTGGANGAWYDPSDLSTLFSATGVPAVVNDPIERMLDKSGNGMEMTREVVTANRPILRQDGGGNYYLEFDGTNDSLGVPGNLAAWGTISEMSVFFAFREISRKSLATIFSLSDQGTTSRYWAANLFNATTQYLFDCGGATAPNRLAATLSAVGTDSVMTFKCSVNENLQSIRRNGTTIASDATGHSVNTGPASIGNDFYIGATDLNSGVANYANIRFYGGIFVNDQLSDTDRDLAEAWLAAKCGVTL